MSYQAIGAATMANGVTTVDCQKQVRSWQLLRSLIELLIPSCNCTTFIEEEQESRQQKNTNLQYYYNYHHLNKPILITSSTTIITGTLFGFRRGKVSFCIQSNSKSTIPILVLELAVPTTILAREMQGGVLRIALESTASTTTTSHAGGYNKANYGYSNSLLSMPVWTMYCNGRRVGYAVKRRPTKGDMDALRLMGSVVAGAGVISGKELDRDDDDQLLYLRANFERVSGSSEAESFHLIDPDGDIGHHQELSIFFFRSR